MNTTPTNRNELPWRYLLGRRKRMADLIGAGGLLALTWPVAALIGCGLKLDSPGPALFVQERVGRNEKLFRLYKFRTMTTDTSTASICTDERRVTRMGAVLRRTRLDEWPQLWNVVRGDMSLIGPRPELPTYVAGYSADERLTLRVRPGLGDEASLASLDEAQELAQAADAEEYYRSVLLPKKLAYSLAALHQAGLRHDLGLALRACVILAARASRSCRLRTVDVPCKGVIAS